MQKPITLTKGKAEMAQNLNVLQRGMLMTALMAHMMGQEYTIKDQAVQVVYNAFMSQRIAPAECERMDYSPDFNNDWNLYGRKGSKQEAWREWRQLTYNEKIAMRAHIPYYLRVTEMKYRLDFNRYIKRRKWESPVYGQGNTLLYDPDNSVSVVSYSPQTRADLVYSDSRKMWVYSGQLPFVDGLDTRPEGTKVLLSNNRGTLTWEKGSWVPTLNI